MDRNMITVMSGQVVDFYDRDFRELYAVSEKMDLYKEFHVSPPAANAATTRSKVGTIRPPLPATTSRFQVSLGDSRRANIQVPAHKYYNPKYSLVFGDVQRPMGSLQEPGPTRGSDLAEVREETDPAGPLVAGGEQVDRMSPLPSEGAGEHFKSIKKKFGWTPKFSRKKQSSKDILDNMAAASEDPSTTESKRTDENEDDSEVVEKSKNFSTKKKKQPKLGRRTESEQTVNTAADSESKSGTKWTE